MGLCYHAARSGNYELAVFEFLGTFTYEIHWRTETSHTIVGKGSEKYADIYDARYAAVLHLANILPRKQAERLICSQAELTWEVWPPASGQSHSQ